MWKSRIAAFILIAGIYWSLSGCSSASLNVNISSNQMNIEKARIIIEFKNNTGKTIYVLAVDKNIHYVPDVIDKSRKFIKLDYSAPRRYTDGGYLVNLNSFANRWPRIISIPPGKGYKDTMITSIDCITFDPGEYKLHILVAYNDTPIANKVISMAEYEKWAKIVRSNTIKIKI